MNKVLTSLLTGSGGMFGWGIADFIAGSVIAKIGDLKTFFWMQFFGLLANIAVGVFYLPNSLKFDFSFLPLVIVASIAYTVGYMLLYKAFAKGELSIVSPIAATNAIFTVLVAIVLFGQKLINYQPSGIILVILGAMLISIDFKKLYSGNVSLTIGVKEALLAALLFGFVYWPISEYVTERTDWVAFNILVKLFCVVLFVVYRNLFHNNLDLIKNISKNLWLPLLMIGLLDLIGILSVNFGISVADSALVVPISSAFSLVTVLLAVIVKREKTSISQKLAIAMIIGGVIMVGI